MQSVIEIHQKNLLHNVTQLSKQIKNGAKFIAVVKGNAYGHGLREIVTCIDTLVDGYHVDDIVELQQLREISKKTALVLGYIDEDSLKNAMELQCTLAACSKEQLLRINKVASLLNIVQPIHLKIDALVGRMGFFESDIKDVLQLLDTLNSVKLTGVYSHLTGLKDHINYEHTRKQIALFTKCVEQIQTKYPTTSRLDIHISSSAGLFIPEIRDNKLFTLYRIGKALYGIWPSKALEQTIKLKPVLAWRTKIAQIKKFPADYPIGYHATIKTDLPVVAAVIPQGYSDGYDKKLSENSLVLIKGKKCKILGKVAMSMFLVDMNGIKNINEGDTVTLIGQEGSSEITVEDLGGFMQATSCEMLSKISPLIPRKII